MSCCNKPNKYVRLINRRFKQHNKNDVEVTTVMLLALLIGLVIGLTIGGLLIEDAVDQCHEAARGNQEVIEEIQREFGLAH